MTETWSTSIDLIDDNYKREQFKINQSYYESNKEKFNKEVGDNTRMLV